MEIQKTKNRLFSLKSRLMTLILLFLFSLSLSAEELPDTSVPVVFVHGILSQGAIFLKMELHFEKDGFTCYKYDYPSVTKTIEEHGQDFLIWVDKNIGNKEFYLISHSMGNLICREAFQSRPDLNIKRWAMIAPPNKGAQISDILNDIKLYEWITRTPGQQLRYSMAEHFRIMPPPTVDFAIIAGGLGDNKGYNPLLDGDDDGEVRVSETFLDGYDDHIVLSHIHSNLLFYKDTYRQIIHYFATGKFKR